MDKVKITQEQADEIVYHLQLHSNIEILRMHNGTGNSKWNDGDSLTKCILEMDEETLIKALYIGYEVKETPEDKVREYFKTTANSQGNSQYEVGYNLGSRNAIMETLNLLNIKIEGVNHE
jgi:1,2-phenylacetyl-CoA epoxidase catalytic subunit